MSKEVGEHIAALFELASVGTVTNLEDRIRQQRLAFDRRLSARMKQAQQGVTDCPDLREDEFNWIGGPLSRRGQRCLPQPFREWFTGSFRRRFDLGKLVRSEPRGDSFGAKARPCFVALTLPAQNVSLSKLF